MSTYKIIELVGSSYVSWDDAAKGALMTAAQTLEDLRVAEVTKLDLKIEDGKILYRARMSLSFKVHTFDKYAESLGAKPYAQEPD
ncbi:MAG: dodecin domain-containing protein [Deltaproteobacteria bacterium]|nr:dodecin domain-containing protein [Deltaproteobacteria bacterium]